MDTPTSSACCCSGVPCNPQPADATYQPEHDDTLGPAPLHLACAEPASQEVIAMLLEAGLLALLKVARADSYDEEGLICHGHDRNPCHIAARSGI